MEQKQEFKSIYFTDMRGDSSTNKSLTLAFSDQDKDLLAHIGHLSSLEIRKIIGAQTFAELESLSKEEGLSINRYCIWKLRKFLKMKKTTNEFDLNPIHTTFQSSKELPLQSWYPYLEGYAPDFVEYIIKNYLPKGTKTIYDPFSGTGTTPLVATEMGHTAYYSEVNPLLQVLIKAKSKARSSERRNKIILELEKIEQDLECKIISQEEDQELKKTYHEVFGGSEFFLPRTLSNILKTKTFLNSVYYSDTLISELLTVAVLGSLIENSLLKRHGDLRFRKGKELDDLAATDYFQTLSIKLRKIIDDLGIIDTVQEPVMLTEDARSIGKLPYIGFDAVVTSPPYLNGTNYFRNTKIELWFLGYLKKPNDIGNFRKLAVTAGINDVSLKNKKITNDKVLKELLGVLENKAYDKRIPKMVNDYFADMEVIFSGIKQHLNKGAVLAVDLGDSIYGGVHVKTDEIFIRVMENIGYKFERNITLRKRQSNNGHELKQVLLIFSNKERIKCSTQKPYWKTSWNTFKQDMPHHSGEMAKRNWGHQLHSLCSYQGKLKPSIANQLVETFVPEGGTILDVFGGVGTIPLEAALQRKMSYSFDISPAALAISRAKVSLPTQKKVHQIIDELSVFIKKTKISESELNIYKKFGYNKTLSEYFHPDTLKEIILARKYFLKNYHDDADGSLVMSALMHILHGNRPYALSRRSHGITPFAPTGDFEYKNVIEKLREKINRSLARGDTEEFLPGRVFFQDATKTWPEEIRNLDAIITSPPFFDSTRFYSANWMRLWFAGWDQEHFKTEPAGFVDELQKKDLAIYDGIFMQARERLRVGGVLVLHLGKSHKCDMAKLLAERARPWFKVEDIFEESVEDAETHGIKDRGSVKVHQYLILS